MTLEPIVRDCLGNPIIRPDSGWYETSEGTYDAVRWAPALPDDDPHSGLLLAHGYAVGISGRDLPQSWYFFEALEPALVFGRAARMSEDVQSYGVYRATSEQRYNLEKGKDERFLWLLRGSLDRHEDEKKAFRVWTERTDLQSSLWPAEPAQQRTSATELLSHRVKIRVAAFSPRYRQLPDGRSTSAVINALADTLRARGSDTPWEEDHGHWTGGAETHAGLGRHYGHMGIDVLRYGGKIPEDRAAVLHQITWHAGGRMWADGYEGSISGTRGACTYWSARFLKRDTAAVLLAALDLLVTGSPAIAEWYLASTCKGLCSEHSNSVLKVCPSRWCGLASADIPCTCPCEGAHHGTGDRGVPPGPLALDWSSMPPPATT